LSTSIKLHCNTVRGHTACAASLITDGLTTDEARTIGAAHGWRHTGGRDYCPGCSGSRVRPRVIVTVNPDVVDAVRADIRLQDAEALLTARLNGATSGTWTCRRTPSTIRSLPGVEFVTGGPHGSECVARTGPAGNPQATADAAYIAAVDPYVGRAVTAVLHAAFETVHEEHGLVETSLTRAAVDLADAILRPKGDQR
jgi:hypothetical protein